ncbi:diaminopimelate decarboxylase [Seleniivibrio sp.]|uniref:diaminopimelate decarboxylase n=1 Tax=Seleniivibrio sp. TaxID=2898801 RepID=UPI0025FFB29E|nr:diaminopimelate decarboxylase [Seleniivibrio sp.]MCD8553176.1 diaminopimelate decarboxylase [Seleniivibrio sp.]
MDYFTYQNGTMYCEDTSLEQIASEIGTPFYVYSAKSFTDSFNTFSNAFEGRERIICFAVKSCPNIGILSLLASLGAGADIVSGGELDRALKAGINPQKIVFAGVGKTRQEIHEALEAGILMFNAESEQELDVLNDEARKLGKRAKIAIRVNPNVDPKTHPYISTGLKKNKFGISVETVREQFRYAAGLDSLDVEGVHCHIGSQLTDVSPFADAAKIMVSLIKDLRADGINIKYLDMGGGLGITYKDETVPKHEDYAKAILDAVGDLDITLIFEPGRNLSGNAGVLVTRVLYTKDSGTKHFKVVDAAMNDLARPSLYDAYHGIKPVYETENRITCDVVGPICETGDFLARDRDIADVPVDGLYAVLSAGAYGMSMASNYNSRPRAAEVLVSGGKYYIIRRRETYADLTGPESVPAFLRNR